MKYGNIVIEAFLNKEFKDNVFDFKTESGLWADAYRFKVKIKGKAVNFTIDEFAVSPNGRTVRFYDGESNSFINEEEENISIGWYDHDHHEHAPIQYDEDLLEKIKEQAYNKATNLNNGE